ncbi:MAG: hypothetical protein ACYSSM_04475 [Planctomycetota bacterium]|jgi:hypothetical protein
MKKYIVFMLLLAATLFAVTPSAQDAKSTFRNGYAWSGNARDNATSWAQAVEAEVGGTIGTGKTFYVDSGASASGNGTSWAQAKSTLDAAVALCTASRGDRIYVAQGHNEALAAADAVDLDVAGITVIGIGGGSLKPTFDYDAATADMFTVGADNVTIVNLRFRVSTNATANAIQIQDGIDYFTAVDCDFGFAETATDEFATCIEFNDASNYGTVQGCYFDAGAQAAVSAIDFNKDTNGTVLVGNVIIGTYSTAPVLGATTASTNLLIVGNAFYTGGTADTFNLVAASTGLVADNLVTMNAASAATALDIGNCLNLRNTIIADDDVGGTKAEPAVASSYASVTASADD